MKIDAVEYDEIARNVFAPIYPVIANDIKKETKITEGTCLDVGCGGGYLGLSLAEITNLQVCLFDESPEMLEIADNNISLRGLIGRVNTLCGDVHAIPLPDQSVNLVISRGSIFFWENQPQALREIYRVLAPGGMTFIGGGFGSPELKRKIFSIMEQRDSSWRTKHQQRINKNTPAHYDNVLQEVGLTDYTICQTEAGFWITIRRK
jgi:ubiquinone/menaquinone biosynthesis C-methylase UbiE